jgi:hypothetical protein
MLILKKILICLNTQKEACSMSVNIFKRIILVLSFLFFTNYLFGANNIRYEDEVYYPSIKTVLFYKSGKINSFPMMDLNNPNDFLTLAFDDLEGGFKNLYFTIIHCNVDWEPSELFPGDYIDGMPFGTIDHFDISENTYQSYTNYFMTFPTENMRPLMSGNYILKVYFGGFEDSLLLTRRFYVYQNLLDVTAQVMRPTYAKYANTKQEIDVIVNYERINISDPLNEIKIHIRQNQRWDNMKTDLEPRYVQNTNLIYDLEEENLFYGCSEWRFVDLRKIRFPGFGVDKIELDSVMYNIWVLVDEDRSFLTYAEWIDLNGQRIIASEESNAEMNEIDYVKAHFSLETPYPDDGNDVYLFGAFTDWKLKDEYKLSLDERSGLYKATVLLKQGYYNYYYAIQDRDNPEMIDCVRFQGSHYQAQNEYLIIVYQRNRFYNTEEIVGFSIIESGYE